MTKHERDENGRCLHCIAAGEKATLIEKIERERDETRRRLLLDALRSLA